MTAQAYFEPVRVDDGWEVFHATEATVSAWGPDLQHGAPPSALLTRAVERTGGDGMRLARIAVDLLGAVPLGEVRTRARVVRPGRRITLVESELEAGGRVVARAAAWRMRVADSTDAALDSGTALDRGTVGPQPEGHPAEVFADRWSCGYIDSLQTRAGSGGVVWARAGIPLVAGETMAPAERVMSVADIANGVGAVLDPTSWRFLNTDLVVHLHRAQQGEWTGVEAAASIGPDGVGVTSGALHDVRGPIGRTEQALLVERA